MECYFNQFLKNKDNYNKLKNRETNYKRYIKITYSKTNNLSMKNEKNNQKVYKKLKLQIQTVLYKN
jgi:hypothetical protein